jgi:signal transduction histidine kinase
VADPIASSILMIAAPGEQRERAVAALGELQEVLCVDDLAAALEELSLVRPQLAVIDGSLPDDSIAWILGALGDPDRAIIWTSEVRPALIEYGAIVQIPHEAGELALATAAERLLVLQRLKDEREKERERVERLDHIMQVVSEVRHAVNSPLTSLLAEAELMLMDADQFSEEHRRSLKTMQSMSHRVRDLIKQLQHLKLR